IYSLSVNDKIEGAFHTMDDGTCHREFAELFPGDTFPTDKLLNTDRPNVLFIIWESLSARFVGALGGQPDVTPSINRLAEEGLLFTHVDCNSFRTDRGLVALLSGYLAQPTTSVIRMTKKVPNLPAFPRKFKELGYDTMAVHGGDLKVFHKSEYYLTMGHDRVIGENDFPRSYERGKWGVHDGLVFDWLYDDIMKKTADGRQWFTTVQTLSSHEPWIVPYDRIKDDQISNSFAYVDDAFGRLVDRLKKTPAWDNLIIVVTGDHGCNTGQFLAYDKYAHIPLLMLGGAVKEPRRIDTLMSQSDIAATILGQLGIAHDEFIFSRDVMAESYRYPFGFHTFVNGFMFRDATGYTVVDNVSDTAIDSPNPDREHKGRVILQYLYEDLARR
ncbi:MAG: LTA synthase family protein, partial [Duncaniella sp.]|nr:LTA synthase family protein [Duncaniella sp.]